MKLKQVFLWVNVFIFVISLLLTVFFFDKIWAFDRDLQNEFKKGQCKITSILVSEKITFWPCNTENNNLWWFSYYKDNFIKEVVMKGSDPKMNSDVDSETDVNFQKCYHGIISVNFNFSDPLNNGQMELAHSNISGLYSQNQTWVNGYLTQFIEKQQKGSAMIECYYKPLNPYQVLPFLPEISNLGLIWGSIFLTSTCISFILIIVFFLYRHKYRKDKYQIFLNNSSNSSLNNSGIRKSIGGSMSSSSTGKISTAGIVSMSSNNNKDSGASGSGKNNSPALSSSSKNKHVIESTLEFSDFSFNLQQVANQKPQKSALKQPINPNSENSSPFSSSPSSSSKKKHKIIDNDPSDSLDQLNSSGSGNSSSSSSSSSSSNINSPNSNSNNNKN
ncbi:hypothetical protein ACTFIY_006280 [Dictyostelium cf. discoideum]